MMDKDKITNDLTA